VQVEWEKQKSQLADLVIEINKPLKKLDRATLITLCTIDVHARDVLARLIDERVEDATCFQWQSQLRYIQHERTKKCQVRARRWRTGALTALLLSSSAACLAAALLSA
jgi:dynein heavy chain, axonemal